MVPVCHAQLRHGTSAEALRQNAGIGHGALAEEHNNGFSAHLASGRGKSPIEQMEQAGQPEILEVFSFGHGGVTRPADRYQQLKEAVLNH